MNNRLVLIPKAAKDAADRGELIAAIQITQDTTGMKLQEAQQAVHAYMREASQGYTPAPDSPIPPRALASLQRGNLIEAIKHTRNATGLGLKEAKDAVENYLTQNPHVKQPVDATGRGDSVNLAPVAAALVLMLLIGLAAYWFAVGNAP
jgi:ribosomal protein L7/L12